MRVRADGSGNPEALARGNFADREQLDIHVEAREQLGEGHSRHATTSAKRAQHEPGGRRTIEAGFALDSRWAKSPRLRTSVSDPPRNILPSSRQSETGDGRTATGDFLSSLVGALPPLHELTENVGIELPEVLGEMERGGGDGAEERAARRSAPDRAAEEDSPSEE